jgi:glycosyltransferase involved in cell wall biosynthesis
MKIVYLTDMDLKGSGFLNLSIPLCNGLVRKGHQVKAVGLGYTGEEHPNDFSIIPARSMPDALGITQNLSVLDKFDVLIVAMDIPIQEAILQRLPTPRPFKYIGIMPVEADPLCLDWAMVLAVMDQPLVISEFGTEEAHKAGVVKAEHLQIGIDANAWRIPHKEERDALRLAYGIEPDCFTVLTVADNQERKNLSVSMEMFAEFAKDKPKTKYVLVTREHNAVGWKLRNLAQTLGIAQKLLIFERGMSFKELWGIYAASDCFLLASKAEGLCVLPGGQVQTYRGFKDIEKINVGQLVYTHAGRLSTVDNVYQRQYSGDVYTVVPAYGLDSLNLTPGHLVYSVKRDDLSLNLCQSTGTIPSWHPVEDLGPGDFVYFPRSKEKDFRDSFLLTEYVPDLIVEGDRCWSVGRNQFGSSFKHPRSNLKCRIEFSPELMALLGYYISEGCETKDGISFSFHTDETKLHAEVQSCLRSKFGLDIKTQFKDRHRCSLWVRGDGSRLLGRLFSELCGKSSHKKHLPDFVWNLAPDLIWSLLRSMYLGDGTLTLSAKQWALRYSTVSKRLAKELQAVLFSLGVLSSLKANEKRPEYTVAIYRQELHKIPFLGDFGVSDIPVTWKSSSKSIQLQNGIAVRINDVKKWSYTGPVYNLEVGIDHSYHLSGGSVHNCMPLMESMAVGLPCISTNCTGAKELLADGRGCLIPYDYVHIDPFGNGHRYWASVSGGAFLLNSVYNGTFPDTIAARKYVEGRAWDIPIDHLDRVIQRLKK